MKKSLRFTVLLILAAVFLTSCKGLVSSKNETGSFEFQISDEMISAISRAAAVTDSTTCTITVHLYSSDGTSYNQTKTRTDTLAALKGYEFPAFTDIPLEREMYLKIEVTAGEERIFSSARQTFTLTASGVNQTISVQMASEMNTPYIIPWEYDTDNYRAKLLVLPTNTSFSSETGSLAAKATQQIVTYGYNSGNYCIDANDALWNLSWNPVTDEWDTLSITDASGSTKTITVTSPVADNESFYLNLLTYDSIANRIYMLCEIWTTTGYNAGGYPEGYSTYYIKTFNPVAYQSWGTTLTIRQSELIELEEYEWRDLVYAYNGYFYAMDYYNLTSTEENVSATLWKYTLEDKGGHHAGDKVKTGTVTIPRANTSNDYYVNGDDDSWRFAFNDMVVYDDSIYILFHQKEIWGAPQPSPKYGSTTEYEFNLGLDYGGYVDRGGIFVLDADTLATTATLGLSDIQGKLQLPLIVDKEYTHVEDGNTTIDGYTAQFLYNESTYNTVAMATLPVAFALNKWNDSTIRFTNPLKIVAIKPKKLVIADSGVFYYIDPDKDEEGNPVVKGVDGTQAKEFIHVKEETRLITVDLENFANSQVTTVFTNETEPVYCYDPTAYDEVRTLTFTGVPEPGTYYHPMVEFTAQSTFQLNGSIGSYTQEGSTYGGSGFVFQTTIDLPF